MKKRALISVSDKAGAVEFASRLEKLGFEIVSTGGTAKAMKDAGIDVIEVSDITGFPECLDGRVKTLHPIIHAGILAIRGNKEHMSQIKELGVTPIDVVAINLYPFKQTILKPGVTFEDAIENIDIGGPTMIRAAAKNWQDVAVITDPADYETVAGELEKNGEVSLETKKVLSYKVFEHTAAYDTLIASYMRKQAGQSIFPQNLSLTFEKSQEMRYGENPHQNAAFYREIGAPSNSLASAEQLHGKELSYNNINDANGALDILKEIGQDGPAAVAVKHTNPCGVGLGATICEAYLNAFNADPVSVFGGIVALNREVDLQTAQELAKTFLEIIIAPSFSSDARGVLEAKKNIRLLRLADCAKPNAVQTLDMKKIVGGMLVQELDTELCGDITVATNRAPTDEEMRKLMFAWKIVKHTKSNAIVLANDTESVGIGPGQTNRITALELAIKYGGEKVRGSVMASDAFFPFDDCVCAAHDAGITAIIQPGGSKNDQESIDKCNEFGIAMVFTGMRHFKH